MKKIDDTKYFYLKYKKTLQKLDYVFVLCIIPMAQATIGLDIDKHLTNYWPFTNGSLFDVVGHAHMSKNLLSSNVITFTADRLGVPDSALYTNDGYYDVSPGHYFNSEFTISVWINPLTVNGNGYLARIVDFGNNISTDSNIVLTLSSSMHFKPSLLISSVNTSSWLLSLESTSVLAENAWSFLVATFNGTSAHIYINGTCTAATPQGSTYFINPNVYRNNCYIGTNSQLTGIGVLKVVIDDLRIYNISLTPSQIENLMSSSDTTFKTSYTTPDEHAEQATTPVTSYLPHIHSTHTNREEEKEEHTNFMRERISSDWATPPKEAKSTYSTSSIESTIYFAENDNVTECECNSEYTPLKCSYYAYDNVTKEFVFAEEFHCSLLS